jgi:hypothetical protein
MRIPLRPIAATAGLLATITPLHGQDADPGATAASAQAEIRACMVPETGTIYRVAAEGAPAACLSSSHHAVSWNQEGAPGPVGPAGPRGPQGEPGVVATNAAGAYDLGNVSGFVASGTLDAGGIPATGADTRLMWYPRKAAFRAGRVNGTQWDDAQVGYYSTAMGRNLTASGNYSTAMGLNTTASGDHSTAMGQSTTASGHYSTAMGTFASTNARPGSFVYGDNSTGIVMNATLDNQFSVRAAGGYRLFSSSDLTAGVRLLPGSSSWTSVSDRNRKELFLPVDGEEILLRLRGVPVTSWRYLAEEDRSVRHIGPMAQDWDAAFPELGGDGLTINTGDFDGVNLAAVRALDERTRSVPGELLRLREENTGLREDIVGHQARVTLLEAANLALEERLARLEALLAARPAHR